MLKDLLRYKANAVWVGTVTLTIFLVLLGIAFAINRSFSLTFWDKGYTLKADFVDADGLANASDVRIAGVYVGQVTDIRSVPGGLAEVTFRVDKAHAPLKEGTKVNLRLQTLLGTKFLELEPGPGGNSDLAADTVIPANKTASPVDFDQLLSSFNKPTRDSLSSLIKEAGAATDNRGEDINGLLGSLHQLSVNSQPDLETFADRGDHLDGIVKNLDDVSVNLADNREHLAGTFTNLDAVLGTLADNDKGFRTFLVQGNVGLGHGINQFQGNEANFNKDIALLRPALDKLNPELASIIEVDRQFDTFIQIVQPFVHNLFTAVHGYNTNSQNATCNTDGNIQGCGGFYLRQPTILSNGACDPGAGCLQEQATPGTAARARTSGGTAQSPVAPSGTGSNLDNLLTPVLNGGPQGQAPAPAASPDVTSALLRYLLGN
ncbi:MAG: phospholipid/cholesterol/gamma-HCH transport system substrate-binding protein [Chloroflexota bacterium]|jgi:phospholipid/cholesterol/gamma-HCH transport system substrate-binding protein|nr:phospholipid/cholesterol/gamma-HCH transport system substrate-binding protein [Chloroflexota bacterium]